MIQATNTVDGYLGQAKLLFDEGLVVAAGQMARAALHEHLITMGQHHGERLPRRLRTRDFVMQLDRRLNVLNYNQHQSMVTHSERVGAFCMIDREHVRDFLDEVGRFVRAHPA
ncbi:MAG: hypothetical protein ACYTG0_17790 [Planctomycetota bacterium]|jgi:hypothetical protein